jgi:hypothetical protein
MLILPSVAVIVGSGFVLVEFFVVAPRFVPFHLDFDGGLVPLQCPFIPLSL